MHACRSTLEDPTADLELSPSRIIALVRPIFDDVADAVFGCRFIEAPSRVPLARRIANQLLTGLTNLVHGTELSDVGTAHKAIRRSCLEGLDLRTNGFEIEFELAVKLSRTGARIIEIASPYSPRTKDEGKKIRWTDGVIEVITIFRLRRWRPPQR